MASFNRVILMGNLTRDPEVRYLSSGTAVADLSLAINEDYKNKNGEKVESVVFVDVVVWARQAETCGEYLSKGSPILVEGGLQLDKWLTKDGENRSKLRVRASRVQFLGTGSRRDGESGSGGETAVQSIAEPRDDGPRETVNVDEPAPVSEPPASVEELGDDDNLPF